MRVNYIVKIINNSPVWPPSVDDKGGAQYFYPGGLGCCSLIGQGPIVGTMLGQIDTSPANHLLIQADMNNRWEFVEEVQDAQAN